MTRALCNCGNPRHPGAARCDFCLELQRGHAQTQADVDAFVAAVRLAPQAAGTGGGRAAPSVETRAMRARGGAGGSP